MTGSVAVLHEAESKSGVQSRLLAKMADRGQLEFAGFV